MENAAIATVRCVAEFLGNTVNEKSIIVLCGKGNNGGDGAAAALLLAIAGARVNVILIVKVDYTKGDARENFERLRVRHAQQSTNANQDGSVNVFECESENGWQQL